MKAKCRICGESLDTKTAYKVITFDKNKKEKKAYYCSQEEYETDTQKRKKATEDEDRVYKLICEIVGREKIINTVLWSEWKIWKQVADNVKIGQYLEENKDYLISIISRLDNIEFNRIRYLSAILKNKLGDYKQKIAIKESDKPKVQISETLFYEPIQTNNNKRRSLADLEDDF